LDKGHSVKTLASDLGADRQHFNEYVFKSIHSASPFKLFLYLFNPSAFFMVKRVLKEYQPDIVHLHTMHQVSPAVLFLLKKYPTVMTLHGPESFLRTLLIWFLQPSHFKHELYDKNDLTLVGRLTYFYFNYIQKFFYKFGLKHVDLFIAPSKYIQTLAQVDVAPILHVPNFIELHKFHELNNNYNLLFVGRLEKVKGVEFLIQAMTLIRDVFPQVTLTIIGDGSYKSELLNLTKRLHLENRIRLVGWVDHSEIDAYYEKASIVIIPSVWPENFPTVCNEAMSVGRPVIGTRIGGIPEIIDDGINGYLVEPKNPEQIAEKVIKLFAESTLLITMGRNARKKAEQFSIEKYAKKIGKIYEEIIRKNKNSKDTNSALQSVSWLSLQEETGESEDYS
jgi:glycosyltransferase involved in cell wall biosynthesis